MTISAIVKAKISRATKKIKKIENSFLLIGENPDAQSNTSFNCTKYHHTGNAINAICRVPMRGQDLYDANRRRTL